VSAEKVILIVSADTKEQRVLAVSLRKAGFTVRTAKDGFEALLEMDAVGTALGALVAELNLPHMDGFELCERIRDDARFDHVALVALSGSRDLATKLRAFETGYEEILTKPVLVKELTARLELLLQRRVAEQLVEHQTEEISAPFTEADLIDLLQTIHDQQRSGWLLLHHPDGRQGQVFFEAGTIIDAESGRRRGELAFYTLLRMDQGTYQLKFLPTIRRRQRIHTDLRALLADGMEKAEAWEQLVPNLPPFERIYEVDLLQMADKILALPDEVKAVLRLFDGIRSLAQVINDAPIGELESLQIIEKLLETKALKEILTEEETEQQRPPMPSSALDAWLTGAKTQVPRNTPTLDDWANHEKGLIDDGSLEDHIVWDATPAEGRPVLSEQELYQRRHRDTHPHELREINALRAAKSDLDHEERQLRDEQAAVLAALARSEAESAKAIESQALRDVEERKRRRHDSDPFPYVTPIPGDGQAPSEPITLDAEASATAIRNQVVSALAQATLDLEKQASAHRMERERRYTDRINATPVVCTSHILRPLTLLPPTPAADATPDHLLEASLDLDGFDIDLGLPTRPEPRENDFIAQHQSGPPQNADPNPIATVLPNALAELPPKASTPSQRETNSSSGASDNLRRTDPALPTNIGIATYSPFQPRGAATAAEAAPPATTTTPAPAPHPSATDLTKVDAPSPREDTPATNDPEPEPAAPTPTDIHKGAKPSAPQLRAVSSPTLSALDEGFFADDSEVAHSKSNHIMTILGLLLFALLVGAIAFLIFSQREDIEEETPKSRSAETTAPQPQTPAPGPLVEDELPILSPEVLEATYQASKVRERARAVTQAMASADVFAAEEPDEAPPEPTPAAPVVKEAPPKPAPQPVKTEVKAPAPEKPRPVVTEAAKEERPKAAAPEASGNASALLKQADAAYKKGNHKEAIAKAQAVLALEANNTEAHYILGLAYAKSGEAAKAITHLERVQNAKRGSATYWKELGTAYIRNKQDAKGIEAYRKAIEILGPDNDDAQKLQKYIDARSR